MTCALLPIAAKVAHLLPETGSEWCELAVRIGTRWPERWTSLRPAAWEGSGTMVRSLFEAQQRHIRLLRIAANLTPGQRDELWSDAGPEAAELRKVLR